MASNSYSSLIRRSKLASYAGSIDQVYSSSRANLARSDFGFKRPLPRASTSTSPFVRVLSLDNAQKRTELRKATRETKFVKKWEHAPVVMSGSHGYSTVKDGGVQSRFIPDGQPGGVGSEIDGVRRPPNFLLMDEHAFSAFVDSLGDRRAEFEAYVNVEHARNKAPGTESVYLADFAASAKPAVLNGLIESFLASTYTPDPNSLPAASPHPTLALQYSRLTPLEAALSPPLPGRLLGSDTHQQDRGRASSKHELVAILGQLTGVHAGGTGGVPTTTWFPDATGTRSNAPGRATFTVQAEVGLDALPNRLALAAQRGLHPYRPDTTASVPTALATGPIRLSNVKIVDGPTRPEPGTQAYSGDLPAERGGLLSINERLNGRRPRDLMAMGSPRETYDRKEANSRVKELRRADGRDYKVPPRKKSLTKDTLEDLLTGLGI